MAKKSFMIGDHDFTKLSFIPDAYLLHELPEPDDSEGSPKVGEWYTGQVYYGLKEYVTGDSSVMYWTAGLSEVMILHFEKLPACLCAYTDGGSERKVDSSSVQKSYISVLSKHDFDDFHTGIYLKGAIQ